MASSEIVYNNANPEHIALPSMMGQPKEGQLVGSPLECLAEIAGRICYDSLGQGRTSEEYHKHILDVGHLSVYEHCAFTVKFSEWHCPWTGALLNRPGLYFRHDEDGVRVTTNFRAVLEWNKRTTQESRPATLIGKQLQWAAAKLAPQIFGAPKLGRIIVDLVPPSNTHEVWISFWLRGSRGFSHEMVRHGDWTAISQRSTRYVDESDSPMCWHPEIVERLFKPFTHSLDEAELDELVEDCRRRYDLIVSGLMHLGCDRKTARGAARGVLPNALETQMIFSASLHQWNHIFGMRCSPFADGEIRAIMQEAKNKLFPPRIELETEDDT